MILIITHKKDFTADFLIDKLNSTGVSYRRLNCEDILKKSYKFSFKDGVSFELLGENKYNAVWFRRIKYPDMDDVSHHERLYLIGEMEAFLKGLFNLLDSNWVSSPFAVYRAEYKILQLKTALQLGFKVPETLLTNSKDELKAFYHNCSGDMIIKPIGNTRIDNPEDTKFIFTNKLGVDIITHIEDYVLTPCIYQKNIPKAYELRITVVGQKLFTAAIHSQEDPETRIDWRRKASAFKEAELPEEVAARCIKLVAALGLQFGAIDMIKTPEGEYVFLEINPNGQWAWIQAETGLPIAEALIDVLSREKID